MKFGHISGALHSNIIDLTGKLLDPSEYFISKFVLMKNTEDLKDVNLSLK